MKFSKNNRLKKINTTEFLEKNKKVNYIALLLKEEGNGKKQRSRQLQK